MSASNPTTIYVVIYCRVSDPGQATVKEQERWARELAAKWGWVVIEVVIDEGISGDAMDRPGLLRLEEIFRAHQKAKQPVTRLIVWHTDRLSRADSLDAFEMLAKLRRSGLRHVATHQREIDLMNRLDRTLWALEQDHSSNPFLATMAERALSGMAEVAQAGFWIGRVPLGYRLEKKPGAHGAGKRRRSGVLHIDPETAPTVAELFRRYASGESTTDLAGWLTTIVRPPSAVCWSAQTIRQLLMSQLYAGVREFGKRAAGKHVRLKDGTPVPQTDEGEDNLEAAMTWTVPSLAIVTDDLFEEVQKRLRKGRRRSQRKASDPLPLSGLGTCGHCGGPLHAVNAKQKTRAGETKTHRHLVCANRVRYKANGCVDGTSGANHDFILRQVVTYLVGFLDDNDMGGKLAGIAQEQADDAVRQRQTHIDSLTRLITQTDADIARGQKRLLSADDDMVGEYQEAIRRAREVRARAQAELEEVGRNAVRPEFDPERFRAFCATLRKVQTVVASGRCLPSLRPLLAEIMVGFTLHCERDGRGRSAPKSVTVEMPEWLLALVSSASPAFKLHIDIPLR